MMGERTVMQEALFYGFSIERHVPADHLLLSTASSTYPATRWTMPPGVLRAR